ncbi:MAG: imelysin family protein [Pseudobacteriovorax sp.]|nr:imelysin family protein [Pseudobacteriovorax sp.]
MIRSLLAPIGFAVLVISNCDSSGNKNTSSVDRSGQLKFWANTVFVPGYADLKTESTSFSIAVSSLCQNKTQENLDLLKTQWQSLHESFSVVEPFKVGPFLDFEDEFNFWPTRETSVDNFLADGQFDQTTFAEASVLAKSFSSIDYILYQKSPEQLVAELNENTNPTCNYLTSWSEYFLTKVDELNTLWQAETGSFYTAFVNAGTDQTEYSNQKIVFDLMINAITQGFQTIESAKLGTPLGNKSGGVAQLDELETPFGVYSLTLIKGNLRGLKLAIYGSEFPLAASESLAQTIESVAPEVLVDLTSRLNTVDETGDSFSISLKDTIATEPDKASGYLQDIKAVVVLFATDIASFLNVTVVFSDNDGD